MKIKAEKWDESYFIITIDGIPVGESMSTRDTMIVVEWFKNAFPEIAKVIENASN